MTPFPELHLHERQRRGGAPEEYAKDINLDLYAYEWEAGKAYGVIIVDFGPRRSPKKIYGTNFQ